MSSDSSKSSRSSSVSAGPTYSRGSKWSGQSNRSNSSAFLNHSSSPKLPSDDDQDDIPELNASQRKQVLQLVLSLGFVLAILTLIAPWMTSPPGVDTAKEECFVLHGFLYCNRDCLPRHRNEEKLSVFTKLYPNNPTFKITKPYIFGQSTKYCVSRHELDHLWLARQLEFTIGELDRQKKNSGWQIVA